MKKYIVACLLLCVAQLSAYTEDKPSLLCNAAYAGNLEEVQKLIAGGANINEPSIKEVRWGDTTRITPIFAAIESGKIEVLDAFIRAGADLNYTGYRNFVSTWPLTVAVQNFFQGNRRFSKESLSFSLQAIDMLIHHGAYKGYEEAFSSFHWYYSSRQPEHAAVAKFLFTQLLKYRETLGDKVNKNMVWDLLERDWEFRSGTIDLGWFNLLLDSVLDVNFKHPSSGSTLLHCIADGYSGNMGTGIYTGIYIYNGTHNLQNRINMINVLVKRGANLKAKNFKGKTPYDIALKNNNVELAQALKFKSTAFYHQILDVFFTS